MKTISLLFVSISLIGIFVVPVVMKTVEQFNQVVSTLSQLGF